MALTRTDYAKGKLQVPVPERAGNVTAIRGAVTFIEAPTIATTVELFPLPAGCTLVDFVLESDDIDMGANPTVTMSVGLMSGDAGVQDDTRIVGAEILAAVTIGQAGGVARPTLASAFRIPKASAQRGVGLKFPAAPTTFQAGTIGFTAFIATS